MHKLLHGHHRGVPSILIVIGLPFVLAGTFLFIVNTFLAKDEPLPDDSALLPNMVAVSAADNAYEAVKEMRQLDVQGYNADGTPRTDAQLESMLRGDSWDAEAAQRILDQHQREIALVHEAAAKPHYQDPALANVATFDVRTYLWPMGTPRMAAKYTVLHALALVHDGKVVEGLDEAMIVARFGSVLENGDGVLIDYLVGNAVVQAGLTTIRQIALDYPIPVDAGQKSIQQLADLGDSRPAEIRAFQMEYLFSKSYLSTYRRLDTLYTSFNVGFDVSGRTVEPPGTWLARAIQDSGLARFYYLPNQTWRYRVEEARRAATLASTSCATMNDTPEVVKYLDGFSWKCLVTRNVIGKALHDIGAVSLSGVTTRRCHETLAATATQAVIAINMYKQETENIPTGLDQLVPKYLSAALVDPYSGQPVPYRAAAASIYSVGPKHLDIGGSPIGVDWQKEDNPSFLVSR